MSLQREGNKKKVLGIFQFYFLVQGAHLMALTRIQKPSPSGAGELSGCVIASRKLVALAAWLTN
jgi:hypothetical protein